MNANDQESVDDEDDTQARRSDALLKWLSLRFAFTAMKNRRSVDRLVVNKRITAGF